MTRQSSITITIPGQAPSKSNYRHFSKGWQRKWKRIKDFEGEVGKAATAAGAKKLAKKYDSVRVDVVGYRQNADPDNWLKSCIDGLKNVAFPDDKDVASSARREQDKGKARVEITITFN